MLPFVEDAPVTQSHEEWLHRRRTGVGGSDAATLMGANPYRDEFCAYVDKVCDELPPDIMRETAYWGIKLEDLVAEEFEKRENEERARRDLFLIKVIKPTHTYRSTRLPFAMATIDRWVAYAEPLVYTEMMREKLLNPELFFVSAAPDAGSPYWYQVIGILEVKTASAYKVKEWEAGVPEYAFNQLQHYFMVTGLKQGWAAALLGGQRFISHEVDRDDGYIERLAETEASFWNRVLNKDCPTPDPTCSDAYEARERYERNLGPAPADHTPASKRFTRAPKKVVTPAEDFGPAKATGSKLPGWGKAEATF